MLRLLDLPNEVLDITFSNLRQQELYNLCLVSRKTYASARSYLYNDVTIYDRKDFGGTGSLNGLRSFTRTIWKNPKLAEQITSLKLVDAPVRSSSSLRSEADWMTFKPYHPFPRPDDKVEVNLANDLCEMVDNEFSGVEFIKTNAEFMKSHLRANSRCGLLGMVLNRLNARVRTLYVDIEKNTACTKMDPPINVLTGGRLEYVNLRTVTVRGHEFYKKEGVPILHADGWAWMPVLKNMTLDNLVVKDLCLKRGDTFAGLEHVTITNSTLDFHLSDLLTPNLRSLAIENCRYSKFELLERKSLAEEWPCKESLESLTILDSDCCAQGSFAAYTQLKYLALQATEWLQEVANAPAHTRPSIESLLPGSLVGLHIGNIFMDEFPPRAATCARIESQMLALLRSRNAGAHPDLEFVEASVSGRHDGRRAGAPPKRQLRVRELLQKAYRDAGPRENSHGQLVEIFFTMLCSCVWDCKHVEQATGVAPEQVANSCWLAQERTFKRTGVAVPAA